MNKGWKEIAREAQRKAIFDAAIKLFEAKGFLMTTMDEIAEKAGISKVTLYRIFHSKENLFLSIMDKLHEEIAEKLEEVRGENFSLSFKSFLEVVFENLQRRYGLIRIMMNESMESPIFKEKKKELFQRIRKNREALLKVLKEIISQGVEEGCVTCDINKLTLFIFSTFKGIASEIPFHEPTEFREFVEFSKERLLQIVGLKEV